MPCWEQACSTPPGLFLWWRGAKMGVLWEQAGHVNEDMFWIMPRIWDFFKNYGWKDSGGGVYYIRGL